jgi:hypothetical protein
VKLNIALTEITQPNIYICRTIGAIVTQRSMKIFCKSLWKYTVDPSDKLHHQCYEETVFDFKKMFW